MSSHRHRKRSVFARIFASKVAVEEACRRSSRSSDDNQETSSTILSTLKDLKYGSMRSVIDLSPLNCFIETPHFQTEHLTTVKSLLKQFKQAHFMTKLDLKDAYLSMAITGYTSSE